MKKKLITIILTAAMAASVLAGCGGKKETAAETGASSGTQKETQADSGDASEASAETSEEVVTLHVADWESDEMNAAMQNAFDTIFSVEHPNIKVEIVEGSYSDYGQQMQAMMTAGEAPDVFQYGYDGAASFYRRGLLTDWSEKLAEEPEFAEGFYGGTMEGWQYQGATYGLPGLVNVYGFFYNKDLLAAAGLEEPKEGWTWDDLWEYGEALKDPANNKYGIYNMKTDGFMMANISTSEGGAPLMNDLTDTTEVTVDDKFIETAQKVASLIADGTLPPKNYEATNMFSMFEAGDIALIYEGQWHIDSLLKNCPDLNWGYAPTPVGSVKATTTYDTVGWVSPKNLPHPEETWELIKFMSSEMYQTVLKETPVAACANIAAADVFYETVTEKGFEDAAKAVQTMMAVEDKNGVRYAADWGSDAGKVWDPDFNNFMDSKGDTSPELLKELAERVNAVIAAN